MPSKAAFPGLTLRKLADQSSGQRVKRFDPETGESYLLNPATGAAEPWPLLGVMIVGDPPKRATMSTSYVSAARTEGWITVEGEQAVHRPGGPPANAWAVTHTFLHLEALTIHAVDGPVRYLVVENPDKWPDDKDGDDLGFGGDVRHYYRLELDEKAS